MIQSMTRGQLMTRGKSMKLACLIHGIALLAVFVPIAARSADEAASKGLQAVVVTVDDEQLSTQITALADGKLTLAGAPPRTVALGDLQRIEIGKTIIGASASDLIWIGQNNHDLVQVGGASGGNGIQDLHLHATNLKSQGLKQVAVVCRFPSKQLRVWRLDTSKSPHWRLAVARADLATEAELYLEPASENSMGQQFDVTFTYNDGSTSAAMVKAGTSTSDQLKVDTSVRPGAQATAAKAVAPISKSTVIFGTRSENLGRLHGEVIDVNPESLTLRTDWKAEVQIPLLRVGGVWFGRPGSRAEFDKQLESPATEDVVFLVAADQSVAQVSGSVQRLAEGKLSMRYGGDDRSVKEERVLGIVFAAHPKIAPVTTPYQVFTMSSSDSIAGQLVGLGATELEIETLWQSRVKVPATFVADIRFRNGKLAFLPDLEPISVEEVAYFDRVMHWRRDQGFDDAPPKIKGKQPSRSLAMHSRCVLTYALDEHYEKFKAKVGFDDSAANRGRVLCRVTVDGREAFVQKDLRADQEPMDVEVPLTGAKQMALEVDFGEGEDVGDRVIWAEPRLFRAEQK